MAFTLDLTDLSNEQYEKLCAIQRKGNKQYTALIDRISKKYVNNKFWWATHLSSRNCFLSDAYENICLTQLANEILSEKSYEKVIVPNNQVKECLRKNGRKEEIIAVDRNVSVFKQFLRNLYSLIVFWKNVLLVKSSVLGKKIDITKKQNVFLVDTYRVLGEFSENGFHDRYFGGMREYSEKNIVFLCQMSFVKKFECKKMISEICRMKDMIIYESFIFLCDFIDLIRFHLFCYKLKFNGFQLNGINVDNILQDDVKFNSHSTNSYWGLLKGRAIIRAKKKYNWNVEGLMGWYEGQPSSNLMFYEIRRQMDIPTIAYELLPINEKNMGQAPSNLQVNRLCGAEYYAVGGTVWDSFIKQFCNNVVVFQIPTFRYHAIFEKEENTSKKSKIMIVLPYDRNLARDIIQLMDTIEIEKYKEAIVLKNHPVNAGYKLFDYGIDENGIKHRYTFAESSMKTALNNVKVAILLTGTAAIEIVAYGVKVICFTFSHSTSGENVVPESWQIQKCIQRVNDKVELRNAINTSLNEYMEKDLIDVNEIFTGISFHAMKKFWENIKRRT